MAEEKDLFVPPTDEELELFSPPSEEELKAFSQEGGPVSQGQAALEGLSKGATMGFSDNIAGGFEAAGRVVGLQGVGGPVTDISLAPEGPTLSKEELLKAYRSAKAAQQGRELMAEEQHPGTFLASDVAGGILTVSPASKVKAIQKLGTVGRAVATGALESGIEAAGRTDEDLLSQEGIIDVGTSAIAGAGLGGLFGKAGQKLSDSKAKKLLEKADKFQKESNEAVARSIGTTPALLRKSLGSKTASKRLMQKTQDIGQTLQDEGLFKIKQGSEDLYGGVSNKMDEVGKRLEIYGRKADDVLGTIDIRELRDPVNSFLGKLHDDIDYVAKSFEMGTDDGVKAYKNAAGRADKIKERLELALESKKPLQKLVDLKRKIQKEIDWTSDLKKESNQFYVRAQSHVSDLISDLSNRVDPELASQIKRANKTYSDLAVAQQITGEKALREQLTSKGIGWKDYFLGGIVGGISGSKVLGGAAVLGKKAIEKYTGKGAPEVFEALEGKLKREAVQEIQKKIATKAPMIKGAENLVSPTVGIGAALRDSQGEDAARESRDISEASKNSIGDLISRIQETGDESLNRYVGPLEKAFTSERDNTRKAIMWSLSQQPAFRRMFNTFQDTGEE